MTSRTKLTRIQRRLEARGNELERRLLAGVGSTLLVLLVALSAFVELSRARAAQRWVEHTVEVIVTLDAVKTALLEAESEQRGYLAGAGAASLAAERAAAAKVPAGVERARVLTIDNAEQQARVVTLQRAASDTLAWLDETIQRRAMEERAPVAMADARRLLGEMLEIEQRLLRTRQAEHERGLEVMSFAIGGGSLVAFVLGLTIHQGIRKSFMENRRKQRLIEEQALELAAQKEDLERAVKALEKANQDLDQFAYAASHDLKAPLRGIASLAAWLQDDLQPVMTDKAREQIQLLQGRVHRLEVLIDGILAYSRASRSRDRVEAIALDPFLRAIVDLFGVPPGRVTIELPERMPPVIAQRVPFQQVWMSLIGNALKHGGRGQVRLSARDAGDAWELSVSDAGPGIEPRFHERIFRMFQTLASRDKVEGAGVGLAIVKRLVDAQGGKVWVESNLGMGAKFCFMWKKQ